MSENEDDEVISDLQLELAVQSDDLARARDQIRRLERLLISSRERDRIWEELREEDVEQFPKSFAELLDWATFKLRHVTFTGEASHALELDQWDTLGRWAHETWVHLSALDDYASSKIEGAFNGDFYRYLTAPPIGFRTMSASKYAAQESESVMGSPRLSGQRVFPVPPTYDESCVAHFFAHTKVAKHGRISPRMHFLDDTAKSRRVFVGYLGRHLEISSS